MIIRFPILWVVLLYFPLVEEAGAQEMDGATRAKFVEEQDAYLQELHLSIDQGRSYQQITIQYEKLFQALLRSDLAEGAKKKRQKKIQNAKNAEMKKVLSDVQFKRYMVRQKEIEKNYL